MSLKRLFLITGDASGDIHGSYVIRQMQRLMPQVEIQGIGGERIAQTGIPLLDSQQKMGVFGLGVLSAIPHHLALGKRILKHLDVWRPEAVLLIDYGMFNLWMAKQLKQRGIKVFYYIPPQVWASRRGRIAKIKRWVDHVFCIFPFEEALYQAEGIPVTFVGHPLAEQLPPPPDREQFCAEHTLDPSIPIIGLFPGSRRSEIQSLLPTMIRALPLIQSQINQPCQFLLARSDAIPKSFFDRILNPVLAEAPQVQLRVLENQNHAVLALSRAILAASGTVTLEAALYGTPVVISYKISRLAFEIFRHFVYVRHIGLPNLLASTPGFLPELLMEDVTPENYTQALLPYLSDTEAYQTAQGCFNEIQTLIGRSSASRNLVQTVSTLMDEPIAAISPEECVLGQLS